MCAAGFTLHDHSPPFAVLSPPPPPSSASSASASASPWTRKFSALRKKKFVGKAQHCSSMYEYRGSFQAFSALIFHGFFTLPTPAIAILTTTSPPTGRSGLLPYLLLSAAVHSFLTRWPTFCTSNGDSSRRHDAFPTVSSLDPDAIPRSIEKVSATKLRIRPSAQEWRCF